MNQKLSKPLLAGYILLYAIAIAMVGTLVYVKLNTIETVPALPQEIVEGTKKCVPPYKCLPQNNQ